MIPSDVIRHILTFASYEDLPPWASVSKEWGREVFGRLHCIYYPQDLKKLSRLCRSTKQVVLCDDYSGSAYRVHISGKGKQVTGIFRHCYLQDCSIHEAVLIHCTVSGGIIRSGEAWFNVETNGRCRLEDVTIKYNTKGLINMGYLTMHACKIEYNNTGVETRGELLLEECSVKHNSVGVHATGGLTLEGNDMENNSINFLRTQPNRPLQRCWTQ